MAEVGEVFEERFQQWKSYIEDQTLSLSSLSEDYINNKPFQLIVDLGKSAIPFIIQKLKDDEDAHFLIYALEKITKHKFSAEEIESAKKRYGMAFGNQQLAEMWQEWWNRSH